MTGPADTVRGFWDAMASNDFHAASRWLSPDFRLDWPQSGEVIEGPAAFAALNTAYPASGRWRFDIRRLVAEGDTVVTEVHVTDGAIEAMALTFHTVRAGRITKQVEYWPDPYDPPEWRAQWVRRI
ncbi:nuclear transport factor 2 family protein [Boseongicola sp. H5]|uniref:nuclear transport factor 2 family protein n=1 Tax=Boseongicola sp. H5 TaxID=2763261 RepID=UPI001D0B0628|nr:nuclear transport factor 2 family protein [Boseongicola sp. H5]